MANRNTHRTTVQVLLEGDISVIGRVRADLLARRVVELLLRTDDAVVLDFAGVESFSKSSVLAFVYRLRELSGETYRERLSYCNLTPWDRVELEAGLADGQAM